MSESTPAPEKPKYGRAMPPLSNDFAENFDQSFLREALSDEERSGLLLGDQETLSVADWRMLNDDDQSTLLEEMAQWADWMIHTHALKATVIVPCWYAHPEIVQEIYGAFMLYRMAYATTDSGSGPATFLERFANTKMRLLDLTKDTGCTKTDHRASDRTVILTNRALKGWTHFVAVVDTTQ